MTKRVTAVVVGLVLVALGFWAWNRHAANQAWRAMEAKASAAKTEIDTRFPVGTPQSEVLVFLQERFEGGLGLGPDTERVFFARVGMAPSREWYCGPWEIGVEVQFRDGRLVGTTPTARGTDCL